MRSFVVLLLFLVITATVLATSAGRLAAEDFKVLARVGPWPDISRVIAYRGRVWFANSVRGRNHNSADIWSLEPDTGHTRLERRLFSQDVGMPVVSGGVLYWPHEDGRASLGWGAISVTNGKDWSDLVIPTAQIFHVHGLAASGDRLLAVTSAWRAGLHSSHDGGLTWRALHDHATAEGRVSRLSRFAALGDTIIGQLRDAGVNRVVRWRGGDASVVDGLPDNAGAWGFVEHDGTAYWIGGEPDGSRAVYRLDGGRAARLERPADGWRPVDLASSGSALWALDRHDTGGRLWRYDTGDVWRAGGSVTGGRPTSLVVVAGSILVSGTESMGTGVLWGGGDLQFGAQDGELVALPHPEPTVLDATLRQALVQEIRDAILDPEAFVNHGRDRLRGPVYSLARAGEAGGEALAALLEAPVVGGDAAMLGGQFTVPRRDLAHWVLLWGIGVAGAGSVPVGMLERGWDVAAHPSEKYFHPLPIALWAISQTGQADGQTMAVLVDRLDNPADPDWLTGDIVGALTAISGEHHGYSVTQWGQWLATRR